MRTMRARLGSSGRAVEHYLGEGKKSSVQHIAAEKLAKRRLARQQRHRDLLHY